MASFCFYSFLVLVVSLCLIGHGSSDFAADRAECASQLIGLSTCLTYVEGDAKSPTPDCCTGYKQVTAKSIKCLCILVKDKDNPALGIKVDINRALSLPTKCDAPTNVSACIKLLNIPPNSTLAKEFQQFENVLEGKDGSHNGTSSNVKANSTPTEVLGAQSSGGMRRRFMRLETLHGPWTCSLLLVLLLVLGI